MNQSIRSILSALCYRQRLTLALGLVLVLGVMLFNNLVSVDVNGWSSGFTHPLHGGDHFLTMLAVGIWAAQLRGKAIWLLPLTFVGVMSLGGLAGAAGLFIPSAELIILLSGLVFSIFIVRKIRFSSQTNVIIVAFFAFFHGFAHGQEISTSASLISYTLGFMVATLLLHGAGILIVRLLVIIFALFISHLAYAQSSVNNLLVKAPVQTTQANNTHEFFIAVHPAPPDDSHDKQLLYSAEDSDSSGVGWVEHSETHHKQSSIRWVSAIASTHPTKLPLLRVIHHACRSIAAKWLSADWLDNQLLGIHFLTSGAGKTSPPVASISHNTPCFCSTAVFCHSATHGKQVFKTTPDFDLPPAFHTLATSFLTNGVGATSPPVLTISAVVIPFDVTELAVRNSTPFKSSTALSISHPLFPSISAISKTRFKSRSPPFAFFLPTNSLGHSVLPNI